MFEKLSKFISKKKPSRKYIESDSDDSLSNDSFDSEEEIDNNFDIKLTDTTLNEIIESNNPSSNQKEEKQIKISELSEENTKKLLSRASKDISSKEDDEKEFFMRGK